MNYYLGNINILLDPTVGMVALVSFDDLLQGRSVPSDKIRMVSVKARKIDQFREKVYFSVKNGMFLPSDFMYIHSSINEHLKYGNLNNYFSPGGIYLRNKLNNIEQ